ncbi:UDP-glucose pyrophosphorylase 2 [Heterostelium album PN500]|uniref:UTP--glucose-1-phosphate uridylyltransferase n=1 Tax=Heterostelium pallidum (strain ATCC 26659 / Pp 5 / PN500) TaxID=670386 RepID=D3AYB4_HETP5|nr:UDP-glucose pyrophosphorylase 2 [Heterostelium album PN500]EFA85941.1 UDP-glucose pyrophosphorylase 2 [Heterostelium album PN500]|eukprot:XP_020438047.1 UDP-glucose pyrophosphorylase 2 [Heterostelium album PN500]
MMKPDHIQSPLPQSPQLQSFGLRSSDLATEDNFVKRLELIAATAPNEAVKKEFITKEIPAITKLFTRFLKNRKKVIEWEKIKPPPTEMVLNYKELPACSHERRSDLAGKLAVLKLNGGLGTTMGCTGPKSAIEVRGDKTFLDLTVQQIKVREIILKSIVPLVLMNSFNTHHETGKIIQKYKYSDVKIHSFNQSRFPRILKDNLMPVPEKMFGDDSAYYPPGHGDVFFALQNSGLLETLINEGKEYLFISNVDNLGAVVDFNILNMMESTNCEYVMEVTNKTRADVKGGTLIEYEGKAKLLEIAQVPSSKVEEFKSIKKFKIFNTNNIWVNLKAIDRVLKENLLDDMDIIINPKVADGKSILQLEIAAGAAIQFFNNARGVNVPRTRFLPVKSTSDLFIVQSNLYSLENGMLVMNKNRPFTSVPLVKLGDNFKKVSDYQARIKGIPDILELDQLTVSGDVTFGPGIVLKGTVIVVANHGSRIDIPEGSEFENKVVSGNLRILDQ